MSPLHISANETFQCDSLQAKSCAGVELQLNVLELLPLDSAHKIIGHILMLHTAVSSGSWCGGQRQQCGDSGSGLR